MRCHSLRRIQSVVLPALVLAGLLIAAPSSVQASCLAVDLTAIPRTGDLVVLSGTVVAGAPGRTDFAVEAWFAGATPRRTVTVLGGLVQPGGITSADWRPTIGERYLVVAHARPDGSIVTAPCQQVPTDAAILATARAVFGGPIQPPAGPEPAGETTTNLLPMAILVAAVLAVAIGLFWARWVRTDTSR